MSNFSVRIWFFFNTFWYNYGQSHNPCITSFQWNSLLYVLCVFAFVQAYIHSCTHLHRLTSVSAFFFVYKQASLGMFVSLFAQPAFPTAWGCLSLTCSRWQAQSDGDGHFPGRSGHTVRDEFCVAVTRHYQAERTAPHTPQAHEDDHIWYTDDILSLLWQHGLIFLLWHPLLCGCYSSQIYHFNGEVVRPEDYLRDKYIIVCAFAIDRMSLCPD